MPVSAALSQSLFLGGGYTIGNRAAAMSAYVADPDYAHSVLLNPAKLGYAANMYVAGDYEYFSRGTGELFLPNSSPDSFSNGNLSAMNLSLAVPVGPVGMGAAFNAFDLGGWRTTVSGLGAAVRLPLGFSVGVTGKYLTLAKLVALPGGSDGYNLGKFTFDVGAMNHTTLADNTFFRAILSGGVVFTNLLSRGTWSTDLPPTPGKSQDVRIPQTFGCGIAYTFASNYRLADFELFRVTGAIDYSHLLSNSTPVDNLTWQRDQYRVGLETIALGILAVRLGYTLKTPAMAGVDQQNDLYISRMGTGFSYGFSLRFPVKLVLPSLPVASLEISYAKNPEWNSGMYHDLFGAVFEILL
ncbi:MAG: hypothetical protein B7Z63_01000 [Ignavibacteriae bacterium 37-53-5]|nr:MAG: hypothetical protein B7Z63_01000 [Ignavibacteriae bacterium 37-53-5]